MQKLARRRSAGTAAAARRGDVEFSAILRDCTTGQQDILRPEAADNFLVFKRMALVLLIDHLANHFPHGDRGELNEPFLRARDAGVEKELQFEDALRTV